MDKLIAEVERLRDHGEDTLLESWIEVFEMELVKALVGPCRRRALPTPPGPQNDYQVPQGGGRGAQNTPDCGAGNPK